MINLKGIVISLFALNFLVTYYFTDWIKDPFLDRKRGDYKNSDQWEAYLESIKKGPHIHKVLNDDNYCDSVKKYRDKFPVILDNKGLPITSDRILYSNFPNWYFVKKILGNFTTLILNNHTDSNSHNVYRTRLPLNITFFYHMTTNYHEGKQIDTQFLCKGQRYNHIPGNFYLDGKDYNALDYRTYKSYYRNRQSCWDDFLPKTLVLSEYEDCEEFMNDLKVNTLKNDIRWVYKKARDSNQGRGVKIVTNDIEGNIIDDYLRNKKCQDGFIAQEYMRKPFLIHGRKFDFRIYMVVASMDPLIVLYHDGFLRLAAAQYEAESNESWRHITNIREAKIYLESSNFTESESSKIIESLDMTFSEFSSYLYSSHNYKYDFFSEHFRPHAKKIMLHLIRMNYNRLLKHPRVFEIFGVDFMMDSEMRLWLIEVNTDPGIAEITKDMGKINIKFLKDLIDIEYSLEYSPDIFDSILERSNFHIVFDGRAKGYKRYQNIISQECI